MPSRSAQRARSVVDAVRPAAPPAEQRGTTTTRAPSSTSSTNAVGHACRRVRAADLREAAGSSPTRRARSRGSRCRRWSGRGACGPPAGRGSGRPAGRPPSMQRGQRARCRRARRSSRRGRRAAPLAHGGERTSSPGAKSRPRSAATQRSSARRNASSSSSAVPGGAERRRRGAQPSGSPSSAAMQRRRRRGARRGRGGSRSRAASAAEPVAPRPRPAAQQLVGGERRRRPGSSPRPSTAPGAGLDRRPRCARRASGSRRRCRGSGRRRRRGAAARGRGRRAQALEVLDGRLRPGHDDEVGALDVGRRAREAHAHAGLGGERVDVGEVAHPAQADDGDVERVAAARRRRRAAPRARASPRRPATGPRRHGSTPSVGRPVQRLQLRRGPGARIAASPRNLLITKPATCAWSSASSSASVPNSDGEDAAAVDVADDAAPAGRRRGRGPCSSGRRARRLISAGLPAPSQTTTSKRARRSASAPARSAAAASLSCW